MWRAARCVRRAGYHRLLRRYARRLPRLPLVEHRGMRWRLRPTWRAWWSPNLQPACDLLAGDSNSKRDGIGCSAADLCAANWHVCRNGYDVAIIRGPAIAKAACLTTNRASFWSPRAHPPWESARLIPQATNDLHGCGGLGQPEALGCAPLSRRMGFADCLATNGVWNCGTQDNSLQEAKVVTKPGTSLGGVLCCKD